ncbi:MAG: prepilin-type N-terminal cleavage/methylation domain-containing protein [Actinomycetota bacterium]
MRWLGARLGSRHQDKGFSLIELLVGISILAIVGTVVTSTMIVTLRTSESVENTAASSAAVRTAESRVLSLLRSAVHPSSSAVNQPPAIYAATDWGLGFYSQHGLDPRNPPNQVVLFVNNQNQLIERITTPSGSGPDWTYATANRTERVIANGLTARSIFTYFDRNDPGASSMTISGGWLDSAQLDSVESMRVEISLDADDNPRTTPVTISSRIELRNLT